MVACTYDTTDGDVLPVGVRVDAGAGDVITGDCEDYGAGNSTPSSRYLNPPPGCWIELES